MRTLKLIEIQNLRAIAVLLVILYHFYPEAVPLGFMGVDLFFIISGFVISNSLYGRVKSESNVLLQFYAHRLSRLLPAASVVILITSYACYLIMMPVDFLAYRNSAISAITFWSNIFFWRDGGYFGTEDLFKPLLHFWSLSLEEQFYLIYPIIFIYIIKRFRSLRQIIIILFITIMSFVLYLYLIQIGGENPAFFLMPSRAWQFGLGCLVFLISKKIRKIQLHSVILYFMHILIIFLSLGFYNKYVSLAMASLVTVYLLTNVGEYGNDRDDIGTKLLAWIGDRSYSLYLVHWPVIALLNYYYNGIIPEYISLYALLLVFICSEVLFKTVETFFNRRVCASIFVVLATTLVTLLILVTPKHVYDNPISERISSQVGTNFRCSIDSYVPYGGSRACILKQNKSGGTVALVGNSNAQMYAPALLEFADTYDLNLIVVPLNGCLPAIDLNISKTCSELFKTNYRALLNDEQVDKVIFGTTWYSHQYYKTDGNVVEDWNQLALGRELLMLAKKLEVAGKEVFIVGPLLLPDYQPSDLARSLWFKRVSAQEHTNYASESKEKYDEQFAALLTIMRNQLSERFIDVSQLQCPNEKCFYENQNVYLFSDQLHLGAAGALFFKPLFKRVFE